MWGIMLQFYKQNLQVDLNKRCYIKKLILFFIRNWIGLLNSKRQEKQTNF